MTKKEVAHGCADALHATEESLEATIASAREAMERLIGAKAQFGLTGTVGATGLARMQESIRALEEARDELHGAHREAYRILRTVDPRNTMELGRTKDVLAADEDIRAA